MPPLPIAGEPAALAGGARHLAAGADTLRGVGGQLAGAMSFVVVAGAWRGPASEAFLAADQATRLGLQRAAGALDDAAAALAELAARLGHAQATWDEARRLAESAGLELGRDGAVAPAGALSASPAAAGLAARLAADAAHEAAAARAAAAARLDQVPAPPGPGRAPHGGGAPGAGGAPHGGHGRRGLLGDALEAGREAVTGTYHLLGGADARLRAAGRLATSSDDPSVRMAAARVVATAGRPLLDSRLAYTLPLAGAFLDTVVGVADGDPLPRAIARAVGGTVGAELGSRAGMAACGGPAAATQGVGLVACPVITVVAGAAGAEVGRRAAVRLYDEVVGPPAPPPEPPAGRVRPGSR